LANKSSSSTRSTGTTVSGTAKHFRDLGGEFVTSATAMAKSLRRIRAVIFDWDGVFNTGVKGPGMHSSFNEADSMGTNMLRFGLWHMTRQLPAVAIVTGENNQGALQFATREHFSDIYLGVRDKRQVIDHFCTQHKLEPGEIAYIFDDINDLGLAEVCGLRFLVQRSASPLLTQYIIDRKLCNYISANDAGHYAVRECCELSLGLLQVFGQVIDSRVAYDADYEQYFTERQAERTRCFKLKGEKIVSQRCQQK
jgi:3-deoxy-D-manno-octulosonate 8-phosphate phosphatase (KDO 8-P phosphatase)